MEHIIAKLLEDFEQGKMNRRQLIQSLALAATAASAVSAAPSADGPAFKATNFNHVSYEVADYAKTRDFYVDLFGMKVTEDNPKTKQCRLLFGDSILIVRTRGTGAPKVDHIAYTIEGWDQRKEGVEAELKRRNIRIVRGDAKSSFHVADPDGFEAQFGGTRQ